MLMTRTRRSMLVGLAGLSLGSASKIAYGEGSVTGRLPGSAVASRELGPTWTRETPKVRAGIDVLSEQGFGLLSGLSVGLITNQTGRDASGRRTIDLLQSAPGVRLAAIFSPEHGLAGDQEGAIGTAIDPHTGLPVYSLYGATRRPTSAMLSGVDALIIDLQDVGARFFTYATTMAYAMEAAAPRGLQVIVLDRPNPIGPAGARGPVLDPALRLFTAYLATPVQHGMTLGELAAMYNAESHLGAKLSVVQMQGYRRDLWFDATGLEWVNPSPNLRSVTEAILYPGVALIEGANVSVGRGTPAPFEAVAAPWIDGPTLAKELAGRQVPGVQFAPTSFTPKEDRFQDEPCQGVRITLVDRRAFDAPRLGLELAAALRRLYPQQFNGAAMLGNLGSRKTLAAIEAGEPSSAIIASWRPALQAFGTLRAKYLLYE